ncbi:MAG: carbon-nitrogen hydrolase family protein [Enterobacterales bacterium]|nr:carbon-nitrogen hydrolase family protein [Enterobacterales bacterium]
MSKFSIAGLQLALNNQDNLKLIEKEINSAIKRFPWIDMLVLGELSAYGVDHQYAQAQGAEFEQLFCALAKANKVWIIPGSYLERRDGKIFNTAPVINPEGEIIARYRKIFPFYPYEKGVSCGEDFVVFEIPNIGKVGLMICYDQWFPEVARSLAWMGAEVIICPTLTNTIDRPAELILAKANAIVNQCYFININPVGELGYGQSIILGPQGETIYQANVGREIIPVEIDFEQVRSVRERGLHGLGQTLKSFRDQPIRYPVYADPSDPGELANLGELQIPSS